MKKDDQKYFKICLDKAYKTNKRFFSFDTKFKPKLVYSREGFDREWGGKTPRWLCAFAWKGKLVAFAPSVFEKLTPYKLSSYESMLVHEVNHLFYQQLVGTYKPFWLQEGLALLITRKVWFKGKSDLKFLFYTYREREYYKHHKEFYKNSYLAVKRLFERLGKEKLKNLLKKFSKKPTKKNYNQIFINFLTQRKDGNKKKLK